MPDPSDRDLADAMNELVSRIDRPLPHDAEVDDRGVPLDPDPVELDESLDVIYDDEREDEP